MEEETEIHNFLLIFFFFIFAVLYPAFQNVEIITMYFEKKGKLATVKEHK